MSYDDGLNKSDGFDVNNNKGKPTLIIDVYVLLHPDQIKRIKSIMNKYELSRTTVSKILNKDTKFIDVMLSENTRVLLSNKDIKHINRFIKFFKL